MLCGWQFWEGEPDCDFEVRFEGSARYVSIADMADDSAQDIWVVIRKVLQGRVDHSTRSVPLLQLDQS